MGSKTIAIIDHVGCKAGMDSYSGSLAKGFIENDVKCLLFSNFKQEGADNFVFFRKKKGSKISSILNQIIPFWKAGRLCKKHKVKECIVHIFSYEIKDIIALRILRLFGLKLIAIVHDVEHLAGRDDLYREKILKDYSNKIMVHNTFSKNFLLQHYPTLDLKVKVIPHTNFHEMPSGQNRKEIRLKWNMGDKKYLLFFGQIKKAKGLDILLKAMAHVEENIHLVIAGKVWQTNFDSYQEQIDTLNLQEDVTTHIRFMTDEERDELFIACDAVVLPYKKIFQSGVMQVAMSYKIPIIASDIEPFAELIGKNEFGYLFKTEQVEDLAKELNSVLSNSKEAKLKAEFAYDMAATEFSPRSIADKIIAW